MKIFITVFFLLAVSASGLFSQVYTIKGKITDSRNGEYLAYADVKSADSSIGTTANETGEYKIKLSGGLYHLEVSYIGYITEDLYISIENDTTINVNLMPSSFTTEDIKVYAEDAAYEIIRKAIEYKKKFSSELREYNYDAFTKYVIRSNLDKGDSSTSENRLPIFGILESETKGYFKAPDEEKQIVISKRETANIGRGFALPFIVNFYDETIELGDVKIPGPLSDNAFEYYEYKLIGTTTFDSILIYKIAVKNNSDINPRFAGNVYITDSIFALKKVDLFTNDGASPRGITELKFVQKFNDYRDNKGRQFWMPADIQISARGEVLGLIKIDAEVFTIISRYNLNAPTPAGVFDEFIVKVKPDAEKDSNYWNKNSLIRNSKEEETAYRKIQESVDKKSNSISFGFTTLNYGKNFYTNVLQLYKFNRVQGHTGMFNLNYLNQRRNILLSAATGYGFSDEKWLFDFSASMNLLNDNSLRINFNAYDKSKTLFKTQSFLSVAENVAYCWLLKKDKYDYYYGNGFDFEISKKLIPQFGLSLGFSRETQKPGFNNSDFSLFSKSKEYRVNAEINTSTRSEINTSVVLDPNKYRAIDWGDGTISRFPITELPLLKYTYAYAGKDIGSDFHNVKHSLVLTGRNSFTPFLNIKYKTGYVKYIGDVPFQDLAYFDISSFASSGGLVFYTIDYMEFLGDRMWFFNIENDFGKLFKTDISLIKNLSFAAFFNAGRKEISDENFLLSTYKGYKITEGIYTETGFTIGRILELFKTTFSWRLNNLKPGSNFNFQLIFEGIF